MKLRSYQEDAVKHLQNNDRAALFLDMGLGKTATVLSALTEEHLPALVISPPRVAQHVWPTEIQLWRSDLSYELAAGTPTHRGKTYQSRPDITIMSSGTLVDDMPQILDKYRTVVIDELSAFKSPKSKRFKAAKKLTAVVPHVWGLTGTPAPNSLMDLWSQLYLIDNGLRLGKTITGYRNRYFYPGRQLPNGVVIEYRLHDGAEERIHEKLSDICLSMGAEDYLPGLPQTVYNSVEINLPTRAAKVYKTLQNDLFVNLEVIEGYRHSAANAAILTNQLSQVTAGFLYADRAETLSPHNDAQPGDYTEIHKAKVEAVGEIIAETGSPVLVFYRYQVERNRLKESLKGAVTIDKKDAIERWNAGEIPVLLAHPASAGHGLNLQFGGHTVVWSTPPWSLEHYEQGNARLARSGQTHRVMVHHVIVPGTVDEFILRRLQEKKSVQDALLDYVAHSVI